jgi:hypothetical protein
MPLSRGKGQGGRSSEKHLFRGETQENPDLDFVLRDLARNEPMHRSFLHSSPCTYDLRNDPMQLPHDCLLKRIICADK